MRFGQQVVPLPDVVPVLSAGKHRNPRKGACFMEMASFLAGERWSDHPACTHPLLATMARLVNDSLTDLDRPRIVGLIPDVVGLTGDDLELDVAIAVHAAAAALPVAPVARQNVMAVGLLTCRHLAADLPGPRDDLLRICDEAFAQAPEAHAWALRYARDTRVSERVFRRQTAPHVVAYAVEGVAVACVPDAVDRLVALLATTIRDTRARVDRLAGAADQVVEQAAARPSVVPPRQLVGRRSSLGR
ncbi:hypothetical protein [Pedococcus sp. 2YAF34]|uniref:hypothetical protein n=1 Tax=Pedococcus sp. 2YAF34 TaxID=3233032 RepID=UPI003F9915DE